MNTMIKIVADATIVADHAALCSQATPVAFGGTTVSGATAPAMNGTDRVRLDRTIDRDRAALAGGVVDLSATATTDLGTALTTTNKYISLGTAPPLST